MRRVMQKFGFVKSIGWVRSVALPPGPEAVYIPSGGTSPVAGSIDQVSPPSRLRARYGSSGFERSYGWRSGPIHWKYAALKPTRISLSQDQMPWFAGHPP